MRVSAKAEYACIAMLELAANYREPQPIPVKAIADHHGVPLRFLMQILLQLKSARLVVSVRGAAGGYQLARSPEAISLADVVTAIDGPLTPHYPDHNGSATLRALRGIWHDIQAEEQRLLEEISLAKLARRTQTNVLSYQI